MAKMVWPRVSSCSSKLELTGLFILSNYSEQDTEGRGWGVLYWFTAYGQHPVKDVKKICVTMQG